MSTASLSQRRGKRLSEWKQFLPAILFAAFSALALATPMPAPERGEMAIVFPPFTSEETAWALVRQAGGSLVAPTRLPNVVVAYAPDSGFQQRMSEMGALFFLAAAGLCAPLATS
jgi:hypothetical protein